MKLALFASLALATSVSYAEECKPVQADLVEIGGTQGCNPGLPFCFLGVVDGNHGLRGTTHFAGDSSGTPPAGSPNSRPYSGVFEYRTASGNMLMRETGFTLPGIVAAHQQILEGTGEFAGATGYVFVHGTRGGGVVTTKVTGEICLP